MVVRASASVRGGICASIDIGRALVSALEGACAVAQCHVASIALKIFDQVQKDFCNKICTDPTSRPSILMTVHWGEADLLQMCSEGQSLAL